MRRPHAARARIAHGIEHGIERELHSCFIPFPALHPRNALISRRLRVLVEAEPPCRPWPEAAEDAEFVFLSWTGGLLAIRPMMPLFQLYAEDV